MQKVMKAILSAIMLVGAVIVFIAIITQRISLIIGLPLVVVPIALALVNFFPKLITSKKTIPVSIEISQPKHNNQNEAHNPKQEPDKTIAASCNDRFNYYLSSILKTRAYKINIKEQLNSLLVYNHKDPYFSEIFNVNIDYVIRDSKTEKVLLVINIYEVFVSDKQKKQIAKLFSKTKIPLLVLHSNQLYSQSGLTQTIFSSLKN